MGTLKSDEDALISYGYRLFPPSEEEKKNGKLYLWEKKSEGGGYIHLHCYDLSHMGGPGPSWTAKTQVRTKDMLAMNIDVFKVDAGKLGDQIGRIEAIFSAVVAAAEGVGFDDKD